MEGQMIGAGISGAAVVGMENRGGFEAATETGSCSAVDIIIIIIPIIIPHRYAHGGYAGCSSRHTESCTNPSHELYEQDISTIFNKNSTTP